MHIKFNSRNILHLYVSPSIKSWSIFFGIISIGVGAAYYNPDEHLLLKISYLFGCLFLGLTFLDDWEDCVIDGYENKITMTRRNWFEFLTSHCSSSKTLLLDASHVMAVQVVPVPNKRRKYQTSLLLKSGAVIAISETSYGDKSEEENITSCVKRILCLDRVESVRETFDDSDDDDNQSDITVPDIETLHPSAYINCEDRHNEYARGRILRQRPSLDQDESDTSSSSSGPDLDYLDE